MNGFDELVRAGFDERLQAITEAGGVPRKRARSVLHAIRRRRAVRAGAATGVSVLAVGALALGAINLRPSGEATPGTFPFPTTGAYPWCDLTTYPAVNPEALGAYPYAGRLYANKADNEYVYVAPDGTHTRIAPDVNGDHAIATASGGAIVDFPPVSDTPSLTYTVWDHGTDGSWSGGPYAVTPEEPQMYGSVGPALMYEWTTTAPSDVPAGVDENGIASLQLISLGFPITFAVQRVVPDGATLEQVMRWTDGRERVVPVSDGTRSLPQVIGVADLVGLASVSLRVSGLPDGEVYEVTSTYDPTKTWAAACGTNLNAGPTAPPQPTFHWGPYFEGPETAEFQCLAVLPGKDEDVIPLTVEAGTGTFSRTVYHGVAGDEPVEGDFGAGGILIDVTFEAFAGSGSPNLGPRYPGWNGGWTDNGDGTWAGATTFGALAWIDGDGRIIGREVIVDDAQRARMGGASAGTYADLGVVDGHDRLIIVRKDVATAGVPCDGVDPAALAAASIVWVQGVGPDPDHMTWSWTRVWPPSQN